MSSRPLKRSRRSTTRVAALLLLVGCVTAGTWGGWRWFTYPRAPDVRSADFSTVIGFMGTRDFGRMYPSSRLEYASRVADRVFAMALEKFYALPARGRTLLLRMIASAELAELKRNPQFYATPTPQTLRIRLYRLMSRQPPRVQGMYVQFMLDLDRAGLPARG